MQHSQANRRAFIDRLEKRYMKKVQRQVFRHEGLQLKQRLWSLNGSNIRNWRDEDNVE